MFHWGTSFGFMSAANWDHHNYEPDVTSYDYDAPLTESGALTKKYFAFRDVIRKYRPGVNPPDPPSPLPEIEIPEFGLDKVAGLWTNLPRAFSADNPRNMEQFGQSYGYILYRTTLKSSASGALVLPALRSYARVYLNGKLIGVADRRKKKDRVELAGSANDQLDILVESTGRINFTRELRNERQGMNGPATLAGQELNGWRVFPLPMDHLSKLNFSSAEPSKDSAGPAFYQGHFDLETLGDTFLDTAGWGKAPFGSTAMPSVASGMCDRNGLFMSRLRG